MSKDDVLELLKSVKYPGFSRDIVSFGIVKDVRVHDSGVEVTLQVSTTNRENRQEIETRVRETLRQSGLFDTIDVRMIATSPQQGGPVQAPRGMPEPTVMLPQVKYTIAVASGKGGVGKSTIAVNVAAMLVGRGRTVGLLDLDIYGPSLPILLGLNQYPIMTAERKLLPLEKFGLKVMSFGFLSGNETPVIWRGPMVARMTEQFFTDVLWGELDFLILDLPPGTGDTQLTLTQKLKISGAVMVTTPQDLAVSDVRKGADMFRKVNAPVLGVIENMSGYLVSGFVRDKLGQPVSEATVSFLELDAAKDTTTDSDGHFQVEVDIFKRGGGSVESRRLSVPLLGEIPISQELVEACDEGIPLVIKDPNSYVSQAFSTIVDRMEESLGAN